MKSLLLITIFTIFYFTGNCQSFSDTLYFYSGDTTICEITLVNESNIFYSIKTKSKILDSYSPRSEILTYIEVANETPQQYSPVKFDFETTQNWILGLRFSLQSNYPLINNGFALSGYKNNHNIYVGADYIYLNRSYLKGDSFDKWENQYAGLNLGYRFIPNSNNQYLNFYFLCSYMIFEGEYTEYQLGPPFETIHKELIFMNTGGIGINYKPNRKLIASLGIGLSSTNYFFLMLDEALFNASISIEYRFIKNSKR